ncbi:MULTISPECIES: DUF6292 family protein [unclassified Micromonospora]|uniref:DUF6292 family protein n=1 Tax=unclassified Micromonospora TaxID=2617518 RepID=UPI003322BA07
MTGTAPTMNELYGEGPGWYRAHVPYIRAVARALAAAGFPVADWDADPNQPRDGNIALDLTRQGTIDGQPIWSHDEVNVGWNEDRGWFLNTVDDPHSRDSRYVYDLGIERVASPASVALAVAEKAGLTVNLAMEGDGHPDVDFPDHHCEEDDVPFELALRRYAESGR